jgi:hypothetical protein
MLLLSVGAQWNIGMTFSQFIDFNVEQAALSDSENPGLEDYQDTYIALGGRYFSCTVSF